MEACRCAGPLKVQPAEDVHDYCFSQGCGHVFLHHQLIIVNDVAIHAVTWPPTSDDFSVAFGHSSFGGIFTPDVTLTGVPEREQQLST
jgi:hypothetical protein